MVLGSVRDRSGGSPGLLVSGCEESCRLTSERWPAWLSAWLDRDNGGEISSQESGWRSPDLYLYNDINNSNSRLVITYLYSIVPRGPVSSHPAMITLLIISLSLELSSPNRLGPDSVSCENWYLRPLCWQRSWEKKKSISFNLLLHLHFDICGQFGFIFWQMYVPLFSQWSVFLCKSRTMGE